MEARTRILRSATEIVRAHGFKAVRRRHIALRVGCAPSLVNHYFACMESLRIEVIQLALSEGDVTIIAHARVAGICDVNHIPRKYRPGVTRAESRIKRLCLV